MFKMAVKDRCMISHSLRDPFFGPAAHMHGATYEVEVIYFAQELDEHNIVFDIAKAQGILAEVMQRYNLKNLDEVEKLSGCVTTTEFMARFFHQEIADLLEGRFRGELEVIVHESQAAYASYRNVLH
tara:strand:+ start:230 stop:610 length:381 start_codon:yes stop_codon:yes gene_type:complete